MLNTWGPAGGAVSGGSGIRRWSPAGGSRPLLSMPLKAVAPSSAWLPVHHKVRSFLLHVLLLPPWFTEAAGPET